MLVVVITEHSTLLEKKLTSAMGPRSEKAKPGIVGGIALQEYVSVRSLSISGQAAREAKLTNYGVCECCGSST